MTESDKRKLEDAINTLVRIAYCQIPDVPTGCTVGMEQFGPFAMKEARDFIERWLPNAGK